MVKIILIILNCFIPALSEFLFKCTFKYCRAKTHDSISLEQFISNITFAYKCKAFIKEMWHLKINSAYDRINIDLIRKLWCLEIMTCHLPRTYSKFFYFSTQYFCKTTVNLVSPETCTLCEIYIYICIYTYVYACIQ